MMAWRIGLLVGLALVMGCRGPQNASQQTESSGLKPLAVFYGRYLSQHRGQPPQSEAEFKQFLATMSPEDLKSFNLASADEVLVSSRDKLPYVVMYGAKPGGPMLNGAPLIGYEQQGVNGKRYVGNWLGAVEEVDEAKFKELVPASPP
jgi:hypothetical protein